MPQSTFDSAGSTTKYHSLTDNSADTIAWCQQLQDQGKLTCGLPGNQLSRTLHAWVSKHINQPQDTSCLFPCDNLSAMEDYDVGVPSSTRWVMRDPPFLELFSFFFAYSDVDTTTSVLISALHLFSTTYRGKVLINCGSILHS